MAISMSEIFQMVAAFFGVFLKMRPRLKLGGGGSDYPNKSSFWYFLQLKLPK